MFDRLLIYLLKTCGRMSEEERGFKDNGLKGSILVKGTFTFNT